MVANKGSGWELSAQLVSTVLGREQRELRQSFKNQRRRGKSWLFAQVVCCLLPPAAALVSSALGENGPSARERYDFAAEMQELRGCATSPPPGLPPKLRLQVCPCRKDDIFVFSSIETSQLKRLAGV